MTGPNDKVFLDGRAIARFTGAADARNGRPRRDYSGQFADAYHEGYNNSPVWRYDR